MNIQKNKKMDRAKVDGFNMGLLARCCVLNDYFDFEDDELKEYIEGCKKVVESIASRQDSAKYIIGELKKMTGIELTFSE